VRIANLLEPRAVGLGDLLRAAIVVYWPYTGFEISAIPVAETRAPQRIGRALIIVMTLVAIVYVLLNVALIGAVGSTALAASAAPVAYAASRVFTGAGPVVAVIGIVTMLSALNAYIVGTSRVLHELAADRAVPHVGALSRRGVPAAAIAIACLGATVVLLVSNRFAELAAASVVATLIPYIAICVAALGVLTRRAERALAIAGIALTAGILGLYLVL
jgi:amino acid transporter